VHLTEYDGDDAVVIADKPAHKSADKPAHKPADKPVDKPVDKPARTGASA
jgi:pyrimidine operon attenuation protein/uracil phosphoribosyltransferase